MAQITTVLVAGATGNLGHKIAVALLDSKKFKEVRVLIRGATLADDKKQDKVEQLKKKGAVIVEGDVNDVNSLTQALKGIDAVVAATSGNTFVQGQLNLIEASKAAGVKRFIPGQFGSDVVNYDGPFAVGDAKRTISDALLKSGLDYTVVLNGLFVDYFFSPFFGFDLKNGTVTIYGDGNQKVATTHPADIASAIPHILLNPASKNAKVSIVGDRLTQLEGVALVEKVTGKKLATTTVSRQKLREDIAANPSNPWATIPQQFHLLLSSGHSDVTVNNNKDYPQVHFRSAEEYLKTALQSK